MKIYKIASQVSISIDKYIESLKTRMQEMADLNTEHYSYLQQYTFDLGSTISSLSEVGYPYVVDIRRALESKDSDKIHNELMRIFGWYKENRDKISWSTINQAVRNINDYDDQLNNYNMQWTEDTISQEVQKLTDATMKNMQYIKSLIDNAIRAIPKWNNSPVNIEASVIDRDDPIEAEECATVEVLGGNSWGGEASFSFFKVGDKIEIDDILEAGDTDFFENQSTQSDYFNLIQVLRNPSAFSKPKVLTLYTARPSKDRALYLKGGKVPSNIFLTTSLDFAEGFAEEYGGNRDIWKVRIKDVYLILTMDSTDQKQYQVIGEGFVPVESIEFMGSSAK